MAPQHLVRATPRLTIRDPRVKAAQDQTRRQRHFRLEPGAKHAGREFVERLAVPPAVHIGFADADGASASIRAKKRSSWMRGMSQGREPSSRTSADPRNVSTTRRGGTSHERGQPSIARSHRARSLSDRAGRDKVAPPNIIRVL